MAVASGRMVHSVPARLTTARLLLRSWSAADAPMLLPVLERNRAHLAPWLPAHIAAPAPLSALTLRLAGFAEDFAAGRGFRYALWTADGTQLLGEADLFPRDDRGRVPLGLADRVELGYWLDRDATGRGLATEAAGALLAVARTLPDIGHAEIRCETTNAPSAAVPRRLGFTLATTIEDDSVVPGAPPVRLEVWAHWFAREAPAGIDAPGG